MGPEARGTQSTDRNVEGIVEMMLDAMQKYASPLTEERIFGWGMERYFRPVAADCEDQGWRMAN
jgi:hypothetical protein